MRLQRRQALFVLRIWQEPSADRGRWRASIEHVGSGRSLATADFAELNDFIAHRLSDSDPQGELPRIVLGRPDRSDAEHLGESREQPFVAGDVE